MATVSSSNPTVDEPRNFSAPLSVVVVGNGPVGFRFLKSLRAAQPPEAIHVTCFGEEPRVAYDRVKLTEYLSKQDEAALQYRPPSWYDEQQINLHTQDPVVAIDRESRIVHSKSGRQASYHKLVLATGSRPFVPEIPGTSMEGIFVYRTIDDLKRIQTKSAECRRAIVLGGGLLGLEAANALKALKVNVSLVEMAAVLMPKQLDTAGASILLQKVKASGINVHLQKRTEKISRIPEGILVQFSGGESLITDMVVISAGIQPRDELARSCELAVGKRGGIVVDDGLQTSDENIFAIGECAQHNDIVYGLAAPGFLMADVLSDRITGGTKLFVGSNEATRLKLAGANVFFSGDYLDDTRSTVLKWKSGQSYLKLLVQSGRLVGATGIGNITAQERLQDAISNQRRIHWWHRNRFESTGCLWKIREDQSLSEWPTTTVICQCTGVTLGSLTLAREQGCQTFEAIKEKTNAASVCGSCSPLLKQFLSEKPEYVGMQVGHVATACLSLLAVVVLGLLISMPPIAAPNSVQDETSWMQMLIADQFWKQVTGYSALGVLALSLLLTIRKRTSWLKRFHFNSLRNVHVALATLALLVIVLHTGFHKGSNLNLILFSTFLIASISGSAVGFVAGIEPRLPIALRSIRRPLTFIHILCLWPLPVLIAFHVAAVYWL